MKMQVYLDHSATTPLRPQVREAMEPFLAESFGNPSSLHSLGQAARAAVEQARRRLLTVLSVKGGRLVFTGSGSEADNLAIMGFAKSRPGGRVIRSAIEHKAVIRCTDALADSGYDVQVSAVNGEGVVDLESLADLLEQDGRPTLVSVMWANNETGVIQPLDRIRNLCREKDAVFHCDAVQALGKVPVSLETVDMLALSAHKIGGPKGIGALWIGEGIAIEPVVHGGGQEGGLRSGTENVAGIVGFAEAAAVVAAEQPHESERLLSLRQQLEDGLGAAMPELVVNGRGAPQRLPNVVNVSLPDVDIEGLLTSLDLEGICVSSGSACTTGSVDPSHVMVAMGRKGDLAQNTIRFSLGWGTDAQQIERVLETFPRVVERVREFNQRFPPNRSPVAGPGAAHHEA